MHNPCEDKWWYLFLHRAKSLFHALLEPLAKLTTGPDHQVIYMNKYNANDLCVVKIMSNCLVEEVVIVDTLNETKVMRQEV